MQTSDYNAGVALDDLKEIVHFPLPLMSIKMLVSMAIVTILCIALSYVAYRWRAIERVSETLVFRKLKFILKLYFGLLSAAGLGLIFYSLSTNSLFFLGAGVVFGLILCHFFFEMAINRDVRAMLRPKYWLSTVLILILSSGFCFIFIKDVFGYDTYVPNADSVDSVRLIDDLNNLALRSDEEHMALKDRDNIAQVVKIAQLGVKNLDKTSLRSQAIPTTKEVVNADVAIDSEFSVAASGTTNAQSLLEENIIGVDVYYTLANGSQVSRRYNIPRSEYFKLFKSIYESKPYRDLSKEAVKSMMEDAQYDVHISNALFDNVVVEFSSATNRATEDQLKTTKEDWQALEKAFLADIDKRTLDNYGKNIVATISGNFGSLGESWFNVWVTKEDKAIYAFLKDMEAKKHTLANQSFYFDKLPEFKSLTIAKEEEDGSKRTTVKTIKDKNTIATLLREDSEIIHTSRMVDRAYVISGVTVKDEYIVDRVFLPGKASKYLAGA